MANHPISLRPQNTCTEDKIPVKTIYVGNLSSEITEKEVNEYFLEFGSVASVAIKRTDSERGPWIYAFVTFEESESAAKALDLATHEILNRRVVVHAAKSTWNEVSTDEAGEMKCSLLDLNDDCLYHIAWYLELCDFFNLSKTCKRLECGLEPAFALYKKLNIDSLHGLTLAAIREILYRIGPHVKHIVCSENFELIGRFEEFLKKYCVAANIVSIDCLRNCCFSKRLIQTFKSLKTFKCLGISDDMSAVLSNCKNLQHFNSCRSPDLTGKYLDNLSNLQNLNLDWCSNLRPELFKNLCMKTKLVSLHILGCTLLDSSSIETLASTQTKLESLSISNTYKTSNLSPLATLKNMKRLRILCSSYNCDKFFQELAKNRGAELEVLEIWECHFNQKVEQAIYSLKKLNGLALYNCLDITSMFLTKLAITPLEYLFIRSLDSILKESMNLISISETIKVIVLDTNYDGTNRQLVLSAYEILKKKERKYPLSVLTRGPCIIDGILHEEPKSNEPRREYRKIIKKLDYLGQSPKWFDFNIFK